MVISYAAIVKTIVSGAAAGEQNKWKSLVQDCLRVSLVLEDELCNEGITLTRG